ACRRHSESGTGDNQVAHFPIGKIVTFRNEVSIQTSPTTKTTQAFLIKHRRERELPGPGPTPDPRPGTAPPGPPRSVRIGRYPLTAELEIPSMMNRCPTRNNTIIGTMPAEAAAIIPL